ncbi:bacteriophage abortive infection AbiH family protein [Lactococcus lactis]|uniref:AbiH family protein n=1 Tax=Lactococcus lactis TaxID=1358 RepID=UPI0024183232|nr:AbiH family protein [Lactococcus lactis]MDG4965682.1 bacteriophage abortive infection AbiH family protein [Lactococcus lactis]
MFNNSLDSFDVSDLHNYKLPTPPFKQLIILGNGFDLACGLKSSYGDFFEFIFNKEESKNNYWYYIFQTLYHQNGTFNGWTDIEKQILIELKNIEFLYSDGILKEHEMFRISEHYDYFSSQDNASLRLTAASIDSHYYQIPPQKKLQSQLIDKLLLLEKHFRDYLNEQISNELSCIDDCFSQSDKNSEQKLYFTKSLIITYFILTSHIPDYYPYDFEKILEEISTYSSFDQFFEQTETIRQTFMEEENEIIQNNILTFNYTEPFRNLNIRNIHGSLSKSDVIFGIDYDKLKVNFNQPPIEFSKSYRILENGMTTIMNISSDTDVIKFYGHGLGEADYSYFQAIFDSVDLYHSDTKIIFYWSDYPGVEKKYIRIQQVKNVTNLIEEYGTTFTNKDHGRNLLTKLQLENRLQIEEIPLSELLNHLN